MGVQLRVRLIPPKEAATYWNQSQVVESLFPECDDRQLGELRAAFEPFLSPLTYNEITDEDRSEFLSYATHLGLNGYSDPVGLWGRAMGDDYPDRLHLYKDWVPLADVLPRGIFPPGSQHPHDSDVVYLTPEEVRSVAADLGRVDTEQLAARLRDYLGGGDVEALRLAERFKGLRSFLERGSTTGSALIAIFE